MSDAIVARGLVKRYGDALRPPRDPRPAVAGLTFRVPMGGITALLGPNGAGKSTTVKLLLGLARPSEGSATVFGRDAWRESLGIRRETAFVPEERALLGWMRAGDFVEHVAALSPRWDAALAARLGSQWPVDPRMRLRELSSGTRSRLLLRVALARRASLLVLDEPTTGLDPAAVDDALSELALAAADGATILLVTHRLEEAERICDRLVVMREGRAVLEEELDQLRTDWRMIDVAEHPAPDRMREWMEVADVTPFGAHARLLVRGAPEPVLARVRMLGGEVTGVRPLTLREVYLAVTKGEGADADRHDLA